MYYILDLRVDIENSIKTINFFNVPKLCENDEDNSATTGKKKSF